MMNRDWYLERIAKAIERYVDYHCDSEGEEIEQKEPETRIEIVRAMSDEKLADFLSKITFCAECPIVHVCMLNKSCRDSWLQFLLAKPVNPNDIFAIKED